MSSAVRLDEVHSANGTLTELGGAHRPVPVGGGAAETGDDRRSHVAARLPHPAPGRWRAPRPWSLRRGRVVGGADGVPASSRSASAARRAVLLLTHHAVIDAPAQPKRPAFLVERDAAPVGAAMRSTA